MKPSFDALIGHTGLVGSNLARQVDFRHVYNSKSIATIAGRSFDMLVCSGISGTKWTANRDPTADWTAISKLLTSLETIRVKKFVLISTIDVYADVATGSDESVQPQDVVDHHAYGRHRLKVEGLIRSMFPSVTIVRLPGIYGSGLTKNLIFDLLHDHWLPAAQANSQYQWYGLGRLGRDIEIALEHDLDVVNLFPEPLKTSDIIHAFFRDRYRIQDDGRISSSSEFPRGPLPKQVVYDLKTKYGALFGGPDGYIATHDAGLAELGKFIAGYRRS